MSIIKRGNKYKVEIRKKGQSAIYKTFDNKLDAQRFEIEQKILLNNPTAIVKGHTLDEALQRYINEVTIKKAGKRWEELRIDKFRRDNIAILPVEMITADDINRLIIDRERTLKPNSIRRELSILSNVFEYCIKWRWCNDNPVRQADKPKSDKHRTRRITDAELIELLSALDYDDEQPIVYAKQAVALAFLFAIETGMRQGEIYKMRWVNVHLDKKYVHLPTSKNGDSRDVPLSSRAVFLLEKMQGLGVDRVFPFAQDSAGTLFRKALKQAKIEDLHFHDSRHEACSRLAQVFSMLELAKIIGHRDPRNLMIYYNPTVSELAAKLQ
ncbi:MAG: site-specific integrase [Gammaproteobacteria bacterium]|nr:site-specific integrase [Gammaproteobacteria bacterium]